MNSVCVSSFALRSRCIGRKKEKVSRTPIIDSDSGSEIGIGNDLHVHLKRYKQLYL